MEAREEVWEDAEEVCSLSIVVLCAIQELWCVSEGAGCKEI